MAGGMKYLTIDGNKIKTDEVISDRIVPNLNEFLDNQHHFGAWLIRELDENVSLNQFQQYQRLYEESQNKNPKTP